jgi:hypothetical protein
MASSDAVATASTTGALKSMAGLTGDWVAPSGRLRYRFRLAQQNRSSCTPVSEVTQCTRQAGSLQSARARGH